MHSFGEVRYCARDVLELTEDVVRDAVVRTSIAAHQFAIEETASGVEPKVSLRHVVRCIHSDYRAMARLKQALKQLPDMQKVKPSPMDFERLANAPPPPWERFLELGSVVSRVQASDKPSSYPLRADVQAMCTNLALQIYRSVMGPSFQDWIRCRSMSLVRQESKSNAQAIRGQPRIELFREWIGLEQNLKFSVSDDGIIALGHVAWEAIGLITQTALLHRYLNNVTRGIGDPRACHWSLATNVVEALNFGVGAGIVIPLSEMQTVNVRAVLENRIRSLIKHHHHQTSSNKRREYVGDVHPGLLARDIREALRRLRRSPDSMLGLRGKSFLQTQNIL